MAIAQPFQTVLETTRPLASVRVAPVPQINNVTIPIKLAALKAGFALEDTAVRILIAQPSSGLASRSATV